MRILPLEDRFGQKTLWKLISPQGNTLATGNIFQMLAIRSEIEAKTPKNRA